MRSAGNSVFEQSSMRELQSWYSLITSLDRRIALLLQPNQRIDLIIIMFCYFLLNGLKYTNCFNKFINTK